MSDLNLKKGDILRCGEVRKTYILNFAFAGGSDCCEASLSKHPSEGLTGWKTKGRQGNLLYDSFTCYGTNGSCLIPPWFNAYFQRYSCFMEDVDLAGDDVESAFQRRPWRIMPILLAYFLKLEDLFGRNLNLVSQKNVL